MFYIVLCAALAGAMLVVSAVLCLYAAKTLKSIDKMLDSAIDGEFTENSFTERRLSRTEGKMRRYLLLGRTSMRETEEERDRIKALIADISHQTKTPIANILLYSQLLSERAEKDSEEARLAERIEEQSEKLSFLISSLIKLSRLENGVLTLSPAENGIEKLIEAADYRDDAEKKGIEYSVDVPVGLTAYFDFKWTAEALSNIVDNAVKYTQSGGKINIRVQAYEMFVRIDVCDTGIGISEDETAKVFARFYRSPRVSGEKGVGIGLYLTREILHREGGYIKAAQATGGGSVFSVYLPKSNMSKV